LVGDESYTSKDFRKTPIGKDQCDEGVDLSFRLSNLFIGTSAPKYIEIYRGTDCNTTEGKDGLGDDNCERIKYVNRNSSSVQDIELPLKDLCDSEGDVTLWFLPVNTLGTNAVVTPYGVFQLPLDVIAPTAPVNVRGGDGETEIRINWERSDTNISRNWIIWDPKPVTDTTVTDSGVTAEAGTGGSGDDAGATEGSTDPSCVSSLLKPGEMLDVDKLPKGLGKKEQVGDVESALLSGNDINSPRAAVAVIAQDLAGNFSPMSNIACVNVVDTSGFWDDYKQNGGDAESGCACSLPGSPATGGKSVGGLMSLLAVLGLVIVRARRKRHS
jgi:MYXO-CTERM domain-containing protein